jgi:hypothetical protein
MKLFIRASIVRDLKTDGVAAAAEKCHRFGLNPNDVLLTAIDFTPPFGL